MGVGEGALEASVRSISPPNSAPARSAFNRDFAGPVRTFGGSGIGDGSGDFAFMQHTLRSSAA